jgi:hypothetical protein
MNKIKTLIAILLTQIITAEAANVAVNEIPVSSLITISPTLGFIPNNKAKLYVAKPEEQHKSVFSQKETFGNLFLKPENKYSGFFIKDNVAILRFNSTPNKKTQSDEFRLGILQLPVEYKERQIKVTIDYRILNVIKNGEPAFSLNTALTKHATYAQFPEQETQIYKLDSEEWETITLTRTLHQKYTALSLALKTTNANATVEIKNIRITE